MGLAAVAVALVGVVGFVVSGGVGVVSALDTELGDRLPEASLATT